MSVALITGASRGIGRATALHFADRGAELILMGRPSEAFVETEKLLKSRRARWNFHACDFADRGSVDRSLSQITGQSIVPDVLIFNAGVMERESICEMTDRSWDEQLEVNLSAPIRMSRAFLPQMLSRGKGQIIFVSSISAVLGTRAQAAYHASKAGLLGAMRCLAQEISDSGVSTLAVLPGSVDTDMLKGGPFPPRMTAEEVASTLGFYAFDAGSAHNGASVEMFGV